MKQTLLFKSKHGGITDIFLFIIVSLVIVIFCAVFIYLGNTVTPAVRNAFANISTLNTEHVNSTQIVDNTLGKVNIAYSSLYWISVMLIVGMAISIWIGAYLVTTKPIFLVPYIFIAIIAIIVSVGLANAYETMKADSTLASTFDKFIGANFIILNLPITITIVSFIGAIIMFSRMGSKEDLTYYG